MNLDWYTWRQMHKFNEHCLGLNLMRSRLQMEFISNMVDSLPVMDINAFEDNMLKPRTTKFFSESNRDYSFIVCVSYSKFFSMHLELPLLNVTRAYFDHQRLKSCRDDLATARSTFAPTKQDPWSAGNNEDFLQRSWASPQQFCKDEDLEFNRISPPMSQSLNLMNKV